MKYIINISTAFLVYHFIICTVATFVQWEMMYFNLDEWDQSSRFFYGTIALFIVFFSGAITDQSIRDNHEKT